MPNPRAGSQSTAASSHADDPIQLVDSTYDKLQALLSDCSFTEAAESRLEDQMSKLKLLKSDITQRGQSDPPNVSALKGLKMVCDAIEEIRVFHNSEMEARNSRRLSRSGNGESAEIGIQRCIDKIRDNLKGAEDQCMKPCNMSYETYGDVQSSIQRIQKSNEEFAEYFASIKINTNARSIEIAKVAILWKFITINKTVKQYVPDTVNDLRNGRMLYYEANLVKRTLTDFYRAYRGAQDGVLARKNIMEHADRLPWMGHVFLVLEYLEMTDFIDEYLAKTDSSEPISLDKALQIFGTENMKKAKTFVAEQYRTYRRKDWDISEPKIFHLNPGEPTPFTRIREAQAVDTDPGGHCVVHFVQDMSTKSRYKKTYAIKTAIGNHSHRESEIHVKNDFKHLSSLKHWHLLKVYGLYVRPGLNTDMASEYGLLMQRADYSLQQLLNRYCGQCLASRSEYSWAPKILIACFGCLAVCLKYIHEKFTCHRDIKPDNILMYCEKNNRDSTIVLFSDFGRAYLHQEGSNQERAPDGIFHDYSAPKREARDVGSANDLLAQDCKDDVFSLGLVFLTMLSVLFGEWRFLDKPENTLLSYVPFHANLNSVHLWINHYENELKKDRRRNLLLPILMLCRKMVSPKDSDRPTATELVESLLRPSAPNNSTGNSPTSSIHNSSAFFCKECWQGLNGAPAPSEQTQPLSWQNASAGNLSFQVPPV